MMSALKSALALALDQDPETIEPQAVYEFSRPTINISKLNALKSALIGVRDNIQYPARNI